MKLIARARLDHWKCVTRCLFVCLHSDPHIEDYHISDGFEGQGHNMSYGILCQRSRSPRSKIPVLSLVSENLVQCQSHKGQGQCHKVKVKVARVMVVGQGHRVKVKAVAGSFLPCV